MAKATKLPSGMWSVNAYLGRDETGKQIRKRFTGRTKREAELAAAQYLAKKNHNEQPENKTVEEVISDYIKSKENILSPATTANYKSILRNLPLTFTSLPVVAVDQKTIQLAVNQYTIGRAPKSTQNAYALITPAFKQANLDVNLKVSLPQKIKKEIRIPTEEEVRSILEYVKDTAYEVPIILASHMGLRRSEICALRWSDIDFENNKIHIHTAVVFGEDGLKEKTTKNVSSDRAISMPTPVVDALTRAPRKGELVCTLNPHTITNRFKEKTVAVGVEPFKFHALRHFYASVMLSLNIPNKYAQRRMGHATDHMLKNVYQHLMQSKIDETDRTIDEYFSR